MAKYKILFVCTGNTCRSPMAEIILKNMLKAGEITSATVKSVGLSVAEGDKLNPNARIALRKLGYKVGAFKSRQITERTVKSSDIVICMTSGHKNKLLSITSGKIYTLDEVTACGEIVDPFGKELCDYIITAKAIESGCKIIYNTIKERYKK